MLNLFSKNLHKKFIFKSNFLHLKFVTQKNNFCEDFAKPKIKELRGIINPVITKPKSNPKQELFYGIPTSKEIPKSKEDLIRKIEYVNNFDDMIDLFFTSQNYFSGFEMSHFLSRLNLIYRKELRSITLKHKENKFVLKEESQIKSEYEEKLNLFFEELEKFTIHQNFNFHENVITYFEVYYRFKRDIPKEISDSIFKMSGDIKNFNQNFTKDVLIKMTYILTRFKLLLNNRENAEKGLENVIELINKIGLNNFDKNEILQIIINLSYKNIFPDLELFTNLEPYFLKYLNDYDVNQLVTIFSHYIKNYRGSNFFIQTLGFSIASNFEYCNTKDIFILLDISNKKYFNRPELSIKFTDLFINIFTQIQPKLSELKAKEIAIILKGIINTSYNDKKFLHLLSTVYLKFSEREEFHHLIYTMYYFSVCDLENIIFTKKTLEVLNLNLICLKNNLEGNENFDNLIGIYDRTFVRKLNDIYSKNVSNIKDKLKFFDRILYEENEIFGILDNFIKMTWSATYFISKLKDLETVKDLVNNITHIFNLFVTNLQQCEENGIEIKISKGNIEKLLQAYLFLVINSDKLKLKLNLNLDFLKLSNVKIIDEEIFEYEKFQNFKQKVGIVISILSEEKEIKKINYSEDLNDLEQYDVYKYLRADFVRRKLIEEKDEIVDEVIFINDPYNYFENSMNHTGFNKFRNNLCKILKLNKVEIDYNEFLIFFKDYEINDENFETLVNEFVRIKLI